MNEPLWLTGEDGMVVHEMMLAQHGGRAGVRDEGLLESAVSKPQNQFAYGSPLLAEMAASYAAGIIHNHPFIDGNKRTGFVLATSFMELNGFEFVADEESAVERNRALAAGAISEEEYARWLAEKSRPIKRRK
jgi:death-on-curing protein